LQFVAWLTAFLDSAGLLGAGDETPALGSLQWICWTAWVLFAILNAKTYIIE